MLIKKINTTLDSFEIFSIFKDEKYSFFLDSGMDHDKLGKYSFIGFDPMLVIKAKNNKVEIIENDDTKTYYEDVFKILKDLFNKYKMEYSSQLPFVGGFVGYLSYDLCHNIEKLPKTCIDDVSIPDCYYGLYDGVIIIDHEKNETFIASLGIKGNEEKIVNDIENKIINYKFDESNIIEYKETKLIEFKSNFTKEDYINAVDRVKGYIKSGDIYQANLTQRFECDYEKSPMYLYNKLRNINPAPFASFIDFGDGHIVSSSPERFIKVNDKNIETRPIKGTRPRGKNTEEDENNKNELLNSEKDKSELLMIVDLERNDLGKICKTGTVKVTELFHLEVYPTVFHLVSNINGILRDEIDPIECIKATFPGGSITGAPKIRAMEIIDELEPTGRNVYTGSIGFIGLNGDIDLNIVIRTIILKENKAYFQVGGGIVWDSDSELEYEETLHKGRALFKALRE